MKKGYIQFTEHPAPAGPLSGRPLSSTAPCPAVCLELDQGQKKQPLTGGWTGESGTQGLQRTSDFVGWSWPHQNQENSLRKRTTTSHFCSSCYQEQPCDFKILSKSGVLWARRKDKPGQQGVRASWDLRGHPGKPATVFPPLPLTWRVRLTKARTSLCPIPGSLQSLLHQDSPPTERMSYGNNPFAQSTYVTAKYLNPTTLPSLSPQVHHHGTVPNYVSITTFLCTDCALRPSWVEW